MGVLNVQQKFYIAGDIDSDGILELRPTINLKDGTLHCWEGLKILLSKRRRNIEVARVVVQKDTTVSPSVSSIHQFVV